MKPTSKNRRDMTTCAIQAANAAGIASGILYAGNSEAATQAAAIRAEVVCYLLECVQTIYQNRGGVGTPTDSELTNLRTELERAYMAPLNAPEGKPTPRQADELASILEEVGPIVNGVFL